MKMRKIEVNQVRGFKLGNAGDNDAGTGCTVIICEKGAIGGVDVRGGSPATRDTDLLRSENSAERINAVVLSGGSSFGLESCSGVMRYLSEKDIGHKIKDGPVIPAVCGAALNDLQVGRSDVFPDVEMGKKACENAYRNVFGNGNNGAGTGASCGKYLGMDRAMKTGLGTFACGDDYLQIGAISAVNAMGDIIAGSGNIIAGLRSGDGRGISGTVKAMREKVHDGYSDETWDFDAVEKEHLEKEHLKKETTNKAKAAANKKAPKQAGYVIENNRNHEMNDIAAAMMAAFENARDPGADDMEDGSAKNGREKTAPAKNNPEENSSEIRGSARAAKARDNVSAAASDPAVSSASTSASAAAYVEAIKAEALARAERASRSGRNGNADGEARVIAGGKHAAASFEGTLKQHVSEASGSTRESEKASAGSEDERYIDEYLNGGGEEGTVSPRSVTNADAAHAGKNIRSYNELADEENDDDDLGYDIPFNTVLSCVITNAKLTKSQANKLASILHDAYARSLKPTHTTMDGDTVFVLSTGQQEVDFDAFAVLATDVLQYAIIDGALSARKAYGLPAARDLAK